MTKTTVIGAAGSHTESPTIADAMSAGTIQLARINARPPAPNHANMLSGRNARERIRPMAPNMPPTARNPAPGNRQDSPATRTWLFLLP